MALTLVEAAKTALNNGKEHEAEIILNYAMTSPILERLQFRDIQGNALSYNREETMPGIGFRGINGSFTESTGVVNPVTETLAIAGGDLDVDNFLIQTMGDSTRSDQETMKVRSLSLSWTNTFINGDTASDPKEFDGLKTRLTGTQLVSAGTTSGGDPLSLNKLDELADAVVGNNKVLLMNKAIRRRLSTAARSTNIGGFIQHERDEFGRMVSMYGDMPILILDEDNEKNQILPFTEAGEGGGTTSSSIYCVNMGPMMLQGIQNGQIQVRDLGELNSKPSVRTRVEWYAGIAIFDGRSAARLYGVSNAAVTA
ncbi:MAG: major capsid protein [Cyanobacteria bacterium J06633_2]